jgi:hypothetical protein
MFDPIVHQDSSLGPCPCSCNPSTGLAVSEEGKCAYSGLVSEGEVEYDALEVSGKEEEKESTYFSAASVEEILYADYLSSPSPSTLSSGKRMSSSSIRILADSAMPSVGPKTEFQKCTGHLGSWYRKLVVS